MPTFTTSPRVQPDIDAVDPALGVDVRQQFSAGRGDHRLVAAGMVLVFVGVDDLRDLPALLFGARQALLVIQRIDRQRLAGLRADDQVVKVAVGVCGPDLFDNHGVSPRS